MIYNNKFLLNLENVVRGYNEERARLAIKAAKSNNHNIVRIILEETIDDMEVKDRIKDYLNDKEDMSSHNEAVNILKERESLYGEFMEIYNNHLENA